MNQVSFTKGKEVLDIIIIGMVVCLAASISAPFALVTNDNPSWTDAAWAAIGLVIWVAIVIAGNSLF